MLLPLRGSDYIVRLGIEEQPQDTATRSVTGFVYLMERQLADLSSGGAHRVAAGAGAAIPISHSQRAAERAPR